MNPGSSGPWHRMQDRGAGPSMGSSRASSSRTETAADSSSPTVDSSAATNDGSSTPSMLVPQDQQTRKPASTVSPHLEQVQDWVADISVGGDSGPRDLDARAASETDSVPSSVDAPSRSG